LADGFNKPLRRALSLWQGSITSFRFGVSDEIIPRVRLARKMPGGKA
jgi:hypothetical protein